MVPPITIVSALRPALLFSSSDLTATPRPANRVAEPNNKNLIPLIINGFFSAHLILRAREGKILINLILVDDRNLRPLEAL